MRKTRDPITGFRDRIVGAELAEVAAPTHSGPDPDVSCAR